MMFLMFISFFVSLVGCRLIIRYQDWHLPFSGDNDFLSPQKFHRKIIPRVGGLGIASGYLIATLFSTFIDPIFTKPLTFIGLSALLIFITGFAEDLTKGIKVRTRLAAAFFSALLFLFFFDINHIFLDIPLIDDVMRSALVAILFLAFAITGLSNDYKIIVGFNSLA